MQILRRLGYISTPSKFFLFIYTFWVILKIQLLLRFINLFDIPRRLAVPNTYKIRLYNINELTRFINFIISRIFHAKNTCLIRSLALFHFYQCMGIESKIHIGVRKLNSGFLIHSWLGNNVTEKFDILYTFPK